MNNDLKQKTVKHAKLYDIMYLYTDFVSILAE